MTADEEEEESGDDEEEGGDDDDANAADYEKAPRAVRGWTEKEYDNLT